jgi:hypothetical protein
MVCRGVRQKQARQRKDIEADALDWERVQCVDAIGIVSIDIMVF